MVQSFKVAVEKDYLVFAAAHFIVGQGVCEPLHGHNYRVHVELEGALDEVGYVYDFGPLKRMTKRLVDELDHRVMLPLRNPMLQVSVEGEEVRVAHQDKRYLFPRADVVLLDLPNTTAEHLARRFLERLKEELAGQRGLTELTVEVEESFGQSGSCRETLRR